MVNKETVAVSGLFPATRWTLIGRLRGAEGDDPAKALEDICRAYWYPLYVYARRFDLGDMDAQDAVQELFYQMIKGNRMASADASRGKLRTFLLTALKNIIGQRHLKAQAAKRGGGAPTLSLDMQDAEGRYVQEAEAPGLPPDRHFERKWALELLGMAQVRLREEYEKLGRAAVFNQLEPALMEAERWNGHGAAAVALNMNEGTVKVALHRLRKRFRDLLLTEVSRTVDADSEVKGEVTYLLGLFAA